MNKRKIFPPSILLVCFVFALGCWVPLQAAKELSKETQACLECHEDLNPGIVLPWKKSEMGKEGIGCYECHKAEKTDKDAFEHNDFTISIIVSPKDCSQCHPKEVAEMTGSHHAQANKFAGSLDNVLGRVITGEANFDLGCAQCHGSDVVIGKDGKPVVGPWPNTGIGRLNPDGSNGSCIACHQRHNFSVKQGREPKTCGKCHQGPDHPQIEIYELSKHGIAYETFKDKMNMDKDEWVLGKDYVDAPTCSTCHMGKTRQLERTHDVGTRISWTLRPPISKKLPEAEKNGQICKKCAANAINPIGTLVSSCNSTVSLTCTTINSPFPDKT